MMATPHLHTYPGKAGTIDANKVLCAYCDGVVEPETPIYTGLPSDKELLSNPTLSYAVKAVMRAWSERDVVDAYHDAFLLQQVFLRRTDVALSNLGAPRKVQL